MTDRTYNLVDCLLEQGRKFTGLGRTRDALGVLDRLTGFRELPAAAAEEAQLLLAGLNLRRRKFRRAQRHLAAALTHNPGAARYHHLLATAVLGQDRGDLAAATPHYRRSLELDPDQPKCLSEFGLLLVRLGETEEGLAKLRQAVEVAGGDAELLARLVKGLRLSGRSDEARDALRAGLFRNPRDPRFKKLWREYQFRQLRHQQEVDRLDRRGAAALPDEAPVLLPFVRPVRAEVTDEGRVIRADGPASLPGPMRPRLAPRSDQRNVQ